MLGLRTSSVLVLDDSDEDALKIQRALALAGIGSVLVPGAPDAVRPEDPLSGIRVAVLDIDLGVGHDAASRVDHTMDIVRPLIDKENGPFVALAWTANDDCFEPFGRELRTPECRPVPIAMIAKDLVPGPKEDDRSRALLGAIEAAIAQAPALEFANLWEQIVRDAGTGARVSLALAERPGAEKPQAPDFLSALLRAGPKATRPPPGTTRPE